MPTYPPLPGIVEQAFEEFDARFERLRVLAFDTELTLADLAEFEVRMQASLDALRSGGEHVRPCLEEALASDDESAVAAAGWAAYELVPDWFEAELLARFAKHPPETQSGLRLALRQVPIEAVEERLRQLAGEASPFARACAADVLAFHRRPAPEGFEALLDEDDEGARVLAMRASGRWLGVGWRGSNLERELQGGDEALIDVALDTSSLARLDGLLETCRRVAGEGGGAAPVALRHLGLLGDASDVALLSDVLAAAVANADHAAATAALEGLGALGFPAGVPALLRSLSDVHLLRSAGAAFLRLTGAQDLEGKAPVLPPPEVQGDEADLWDDSAAEVDAEKAAAWWQASGSGFEAWERLQSGHVVDALEFHQLDLLPAGVRRAECLRRHAAGRDSLPPFDFEDLPARQLAASRVSTSL